MGDDWLGQQISDPDDVNEEEAEQQTKEATEDPDEERTEFEKQLRTLLVTNSVESLDVGVLEENVPDCDDVEALEKALQIEEREDARELYIARLNELGEESDEGNPFLADGDEDEQEENPFDSVDDAEDDQAEQEEETEGEQSDNPAESDPTETTDGGSDPVSVRDIAPDAMTVTEAAEKDRRWTTMVWGEPGLGKSHFAMSATSPVVVIDTEGKADELAHKFAEDGAYEDPFIFQPSDFDEAKTALEQALSLLDAFREEDGVVGTLVVDSMSVMWGWSQQKYVDKFYPQADDVSEVDLQTGFGSGKSDWKQIKNYHNVQFRQQMIDSPYHLVWTAMSEDDYDAQINNDARDAEKPAGEKENVYKVDEVIRIKESPDDGAPIAELQKSGKVKHRYTGLRYPTFDKHQDVIEAIDDAEANDASIASIEAKYGVTIVEGNPEYVQEDDE